MGIPKPKQAPDNLFFQVRRGDNIMPERMLYYISDPPDGLIQGRFMSKLSESHFLCMTATNKIFCEHYQ